VETLINSQDDIEEIIEAFDPSKAKTDPTSEQDEMELSQSDKNYDRFKRKKVDVQLEKKLLRMI
jgi:hypothetical protein